MNKQQGVTLTGMLIVCVLLVLVLLLGFKMVPVYIEYNTIDKHFKAIAADPALRGASRAEIARAWAARTTIDDVRSLSPESIDYQKTPSGWLITADYSVKVPLFRNVAACFDFHASSE